jgi:hypothetical protein
VRELPDDCIEENSEYQLRARLLWAACRNADSAAACAIVRLLTRATNLAHVFPPFDCKAEADYMDLCLVLPFAIHRGHDALVREAIELLGGVSTVRAVRAAPFGLRRQEVDWVAQHALMHAAREGFSAATTRALAEVRTDVLKRIGRSTHASHGMILSCRLD